MVGRFTQTADTSGVATGSILLHTVVMTITGLAQAVNVVITFLLIRRRPLPSAFGQSMSALKKVVRFCM